jgi:hypothetical protein
VRIHHRPRLPQPVHMTSSTPELPIAAARLTTPMVHPALEPTCVYSLELAPLIPRPPHLTYHTQPWIPPWLNSRAAHRTHAMLVRTNCCCSWAPLVGCADALVTRRRYSLESRLRDICKDDQECARVRERRSEHTAPERHRSGLWWKDQRCTQGTQLLRMATSRKQERAETSWHRGRHQCTATAIYSNTIIPPS